MGIATFLLIMFSVIDVFLKITNSEPNVVNCDKINS